MNIIVPISFVIYKKSILHLTGAGKLSIIIIYGFRKSDRLCKLS